MKLLLDTNCLLWAAGQPSRLSEAARSAMLDPANELLMSAVTPWEIAVKVSTGRLEIEGDLPTFVSRQIRALHLTEMPIRISHSFGIRDLPRVHRDPFDRMLVAQAIAEDLAIVTSDRDIARYGVRVIW